MVSVPGTPVTFGGGFAQARGEREERNIASERNRILMEQLEQEAEQQKRLAREKNITSILDNYGDLLTSAKEDPIFARSDSPGKLLSGFNKSVAEMIDGGLLDPDEIAVIQDRAATVSEQLNFLNSKPTPLQQKILDAEAEIGPLTAEQTLRILDLDPEGQLARDAATINAARRKEGLPDLNSRQLQNLKRAQEAGLMIIGVGQDGSLAVSDRGGIQPGAPATAGGAAAAGEPATGSATDTGQPAPVTDTSAEPTAAGPVLGSLPSNLQIGGTTIDELRAGISLIDTGDTILDFLIAQGAQNPEVFGLLGTVRRLSQRAQGLAEEFGLAGLELLGFDTQRGFDALDQAINLDITDENTKRSLRPAKPGSLEVFEKTLQYSTARAMQPEGKLLASTIENAKAITDLTGLRTTEEVLDKLQGIKAINQASKAKLAQRLQQGVVGTTNIPDVSPIPPTEQSPSEPAQPQRPTRLRFNPETGQVEPVQ